MRGCDFCVILYHSRWLYTSTSMLFFWAMSFSSYSYIQHERHPHTHILTHHHRWAAEQKNMKWPNTKRREHTTSPLIIQRFPGYQIRLSAETNQYRNPIAMPLQNGYAGFGTLRALRRVTKLQTSQYTGYNKTLAVFPVCVKWRQKNDFYEKIVASILASPHVEDGRQLRSVSAHRPRASS